MGYVLINLCCGSLLMSSLIITYLLIQINDVGSDGEEYINRPLFSDLMTILDELWSDVTADIELAARLCCGHDDCYFSAWDLKTMEIWNLKDNVLSLAPGAEDV